MFVGVGLASALVRDLDLIVLNYMCVRPDALVCNQFMQHANIVFADERLIRQLHR